MDITRRKFVEGMIAISVVSFFSKTCPAYAMGNWSVVQKSADLLAMVGVKIIEQLHFKLLNEYKDLNSKLGTVIRLQKGVLYEFGKIGIKLEKRLRQALINDIELDLRARYDSFLPLQSVLIQKGDKLMLPSSKIRFYSKRLEDLIFDTEDLCNKLVGYGSATYQTQFASMCLLDSMYKIIEVDKPYRRAHFQLRANNADRYIAKYTKLLKALKSKKGRGRKVTEREFTASWKYWRSRNNDKQMMKTLVNYLSKDKGGLSQKIKKYEYIVKKDLPRMKKTADGLVKLYS